MRNDLESVSIKLYNDIMASEYAAQVAPIMNMGSGDIEPDSMFCSPYDLLAQIIPVGRTVIDLGCAYGFQSWYFRNHKAYIGVDLACGDPEYDHGVFTPRNAMYYTCGIDSFLVARPEYCNDHSFAICSYVPAVTKELRSAFTQLFVFYPERGDDPMMAKMESFFGRSILK